MKAFLLILACAVLSQAEALQCTRCVGAYTAEECTSISCGTEEVCYMDQLVTDKQAIVYYGGCRRSDLCHQSAGRRNIKAAICSTCCSTDECNKNTCGIKSLFTGINQCYSCHNVRDLALCTRKITCQSNEICSMEMSQIGSTVLYTAGCTNKMICRILVQEQFRQLDKCTDPGSPDYPCHGVIIGKRSPTIGKRSAIIGRRPAKIGSRQATICNTCCGDALCNGDTCQNITRHLYTAKQNHVLDLDSLALNGTVGGGFTGITAGASTVTSYLWLWSVVVAYVIITAM